MVGCKNGQKFSSSHYIHTLVILMLLVFPSRREVLSFILWIWAMWFALVNGTIANVTQAESILKFTLLAYVGSWGHYVLESQLTFWKIRHHMKKNQSASLQITIDSWRKPEEISRASLDQNCPGSPPSCELNKWLLKPPSFRKVYYAAKAN